MVNTIKEEFVSQENKNYKVKIGKIIASSLAGFLAGIAVTIIIVYALFNISLK